MSKNILQLCPKSACKKQATKNVGQTTLLVPTLKPSVIDYIYQQSIYQNNTWYSYSFVVNVDINGYLNTSRVWSGYGADWDKLTSVHIYGIK